MHLNAQHCRQEQDGESENLSTYMININHPKIRPMYERYKDKLGERILSDRQRMTFEMLIFQMIERNKNEQGDTDGKADS